MKFNFSRIFIMIAGISVLAASCQPQETIRVVVTPTPGAQVAVQPTDTATIVSSDTPTATSTLALINPSATPETPTPTSTSTPDVSPTPVPTFLGSITGDNYVLPTLPPGRPVTQVPTNLPLTPQVQVIGQLPNLDPARAGIQIDPYRTEGEWAYALGRAQELGVTWVKIQLSWQEVLPDGPDQTWGPAMENLENFVRLAESDPNRNINVLVSIAKAPNWSRSSGAEDGPPDDPQVLADFINILYTHRLGQMIDAIEVWNEPNLQREWNGQPLNGASYMRYFDAAYQAIRTHSPSLPIITAGLAPTSNLGFSRDDREYLQEMYAAGLGNYQDVMIGIHPYGWANAPDTRCCPTESRGWDDNPHFFFLENVDAMREIMNQNGHSERQMWVTEFGWATWDGFVGDPPETWMTTGYVDVWKQGQYIIQAFDMMQNRSDIGVAFLWNMNFGTQQKIEGRDERAAYTIMPDNPGPRPAFWMLYDSLHPEIVLDSYIRN